MATIPKILHYVWLGGNPKPSNVLTCIETWKKFCPDYEIKEWNETNFDIHSVPFVEEAIKYKKYAFAADYIRLYAMFCDGGIYMDTDVELVQNLDVFLQHKFFAGFENDIMLSTAVMGSQKHGQFVGTLMDFYRDRHFIKDGKMDTTTNVVITTAIAKMVYGLKNNNQLQQLSNDQGTIYPQDWFSPKNYVTEKIERTNNTHAIHHFKATWQTKGQRFATKFAKFMRILVPKKLSKCFENMAVKKQLNNFCKNDKQLKKCKGTEK